MIVMIEVAMKNHSMLCITYMNDIDTLLKYCNNVFILYVLKNVMLSLIFNHFNLALFLKIGVCLSLSST
jgi:hypothetical protein